MMTYFKRMQKKEDIEKRKLSKVREHSDRGSWSQTLYVGAGRRTTVPSTPQKRYHNGRGEAQGMEDDPREYRMRC